ncbi:SPX domain-containing protein 2 [Sarracenia purpurea var. burkii]
MKFGKSLSNQIDETLPEWRDKFLSYKDLKKRLKLIEPKGGENRTAKRQKLASAGDCADGGGEEQAAANDVTKEEAEFMELLEGELEKFNSFFVEKEEECIIRLKDLQDRVAKAQDLSEETIKIRKEIVDFHGEMVLLENYSALNYTGLVKILKKYDKRTGALLRSPFIQKVLHQPFFTTDLLYKLVKECETLLDRLFPIIELRSRIDQPANGDDPSTSTAAKNDDDLLLGGSIPKGLAEIEYVKSLYMKSTITALRVLKEIRSKSSTVSAFSLPPLQVSGLEDTWNKIPVLEQAAIAK